MFRDMWFLNASTLAITDHEETIFHVIFSTGFVESNGFAEEKEQGGALDLIAFGLFVPGSSMLISRIQLLFLIVLYVSCTPPPLI
jgi:hypothetical protein